MISLRGKCSMCGGLAASVEVEIPHATREHRKALNVSSGSVLCAAICQTCARSAVAAWAGYGAAEWARVRAELEARKGDQ